MTLPFVLLGIGVLFAALSWNAVRPVYRPAPLAVVSFFAGWLAGEAPWHAFFFQLAAILPVGLAGGFAQWPGVAGALLAVIGWRFLFLQVVRARDARPIFEAELARLGDVPPGRRACTTGRLILPLPLRPSGVTCIADVVYGEAEGRPLKCDIFRPSAPTRGAPCLVYVHGGGWVVGSKAEQGLPLLHHLASLGWVCFSIDYRLAPFAAFPAQLIDVKRALRFVRAEADGYGGDPRTLVLAGGSAGAHLASLAALTAGDPEYQPGFEDADTRVDACVSLYGVYDFADRAGVWPHSYFRVLVERVVLQRRWADDPAAFDRASPIAHVHEAAPPFFVIHGDRDSLVPVEGARRFVAAMRAASRAPVLFAEVPGAQHAFEIFPSVRTCATVTAIARFCEHVRRDRQ